MVEFTGERVIPGQVNADLWSEHLARYAFARRYVRGQRVLDAGSGAGYGSAELAQEAGEVTGVDVSGEALEYARSNYPLSNLTFVAGSCDALPFSSGSFHAVVGFEVIEHLDQPREFIAECARVLRPGGLFVVSTPNKRYYAESRAATGPNLYHRHEFELDEFHRSLSEFFPEVRILLQNRVECFAFHPAKTFWAAEARMDGGAGNAEDAHFFIALCTRGVLPQQRSFVYVPRAANVLREREQHVLLLEKQLAQTQLWLQTTETERDDLLALFRGQKDELEACNRWAGQLNEQLAAAEAELARVQREGSEVAAAYEAKVQELDSENVKKTEWAIQTEARLSSELAAAHGQLAEYARLLEASEALMEERTRWAQRTLSEKEVLESQLNLVRGSRWMKAGRKLGLGPVLS
ncbi:MAG: class I SAM-dependent methyltransferase [Acidobacteriota bacterium]|nr:class I SAM-dependent methyltransferase [Acidobacteriota bacterium]